MNPYVFMTDSDSDLPFRYVDELDMTMVYMPYMVDGKEYMDDLGRNGKQKEYFDNMRNGAAPVTSLLPSAAYEEYFEPCFKEGKDILFVAFSSQLSSTINNIYATREALLAKYPERKMIVVDTLSISAPQSILIIKAYELFKAGKSMEEVAQWLEENKLRAQAWFTVEDLKYLRRGGRVSAVAATLGTVLDLKPIIVESREGKLISTDKVQGRKRALRVIADKAAENIDDPANACAIILHADAIEDAQRLEVLLRERIPALGEVEHRYVGPVIGAHCGPGTVAICFLGKERPC
ncbi:MAG: DegV family protein [Clostridiales bacterium]|nr:DegV family protein [Clostridiales bacterium]